ncbi:hypothetical protein L873DRAFT_1311925 [Choiromyces venosus 120613-1]|uniref:Uncharacterized protein n=1 Tax=Choiromyces venosus 120613-1 TaxID=1336337 RepID=A0A3N4JDU9_9PEZI|nr:hypothetical protein L873DRAFT_1311925 [Choiromyces venosus 120613-1]
MTGLAGLPTCRPDHRLDWPLGITMGSLFPHTNIHCLLPLMSNRISSTNYSILLVSLLLHPTHKGACIIDSRLSLSCSLSFFLASCLAATILSFFSAHFVLPFVEDC